MVMPGSEATYGHMSYNSGLSEFFLQSGAHTVETQKQGSAVPPLTYWHSSKCVFL